MRVSNIILSKSSYPGIFSIIYLILSGFFMFSRISYSICSYFNVILSYIFNIVTIVDLSLPIYESGRYQYYYSHKYPLDSPINTRHLKLIIPFIPDIFISLGPTPSSFLHCSRKSSEVALQVFCFIFYLESLQVFCTVLGSPRIIKKHI